MNLKLLQKAINALNRFSDQEIRKTQHNSEKDQHDASHSCKVWLSTRKLVRELESELEKLKAGAKP